jgi:COX assembly protein 2
MHPSLAPHLHSQKCQEIIRELEKCHKDHPLRKFLGSCNQLKRSLNECLKGEVAQRRKENYAVAQERKRKYQELSKEE